MARDAEQDRADLNTWLLAGVLCVGVFVLAILYANYGMRMKWLMFAWMGLTVGLMGLIRHGFVVQLYLFLLPLEGLLDIRQGGSEVLNLMKPLGMLVFAMWALGLISEGRKLARLDEVGLPMAFAGLALFSSLWSYAAPDVALRIGVRLMMNVALFFMLYQYMSEKDRFLAGCRAYALGASVAAIAALTVLGQHAHGRLALYGVNWGTFPAILMPGAMFWLYVVLTERTSGNRILAAALFCITYAVALSSGTRSFMYSSVIVMPIFIYYTLKTRDLFSKNFVATILFAPIVIIILVGLAGFVTWKLGYFEVVSQRVAMGFRGRAFNERLLAILYTPAALQYNPVLGVGLGNYPFFLYGLIGNFRESHNVFATVLQELGILGLSIYVVFFLRLAKKAMSILLRRKNDVEYAPLAPFLFLMISLVALGEPLLQQKVLWFVYATVVSGQIIAEEGDVAADGEETAEKRYDSALAVNS